MKLQSRMVLPTDATSALFEAVLDATEEAIYNSLRATDTTGNAGPFEQSRSTSSDAASEVALHP